MTLGPEPRKKELSVPQENCSAQHFLMASLLTSLEILLQQHLLRQSEEWLWEHYMTPFISSLGEVSYK